MGCVSVSVEVADPDAAVEAIKDLDSITWDLNGKSIHLSADYDYPIDVALNAIGNSTQVLEQGKPKIAYTGSNPIKEPILSIEIGPLYPRRLRRLPLHRPVSKRRFQQNSAQDLPLLLPQYVPRMSPS